jgi:hypothetical protein
VRVLVEGLGDDVGTPLYFPFALSDRRPIRPVQGYLAKLPVDFVAAFDSLVQGSSAVERRSPRPPVTQQEIGTDYRQADEDAATSERDAFSVDPAIVERGLRGHARTQNALAQRVEQVGNGRLRQSHRRVLLGVHFGRYTSRITPVAHLTVDPIPTTPGDSYDVELLDP